MRVLNRIVSFQFLFCLFIIPLSALVHEKDPKELLDWCIDARSHKTKPGPTDSLHNQCKPWEKRSCCTSETSVALHNDKMYNFDWDHCRQVKPLSDKCRKHFVQDLCFYECSPNTGPWVVKVNQKIRRERFVDLPLCATDCNQWYADCAQDMTCTDNWVRNFDWVNGANSCPVGSNCRTFEQVYKTAEKFCETVWDHSWKVTPDNEQCMRLWFNGSLGNPNDAVAQSKVDWIIKTHRLGGTNTIEGSSGAVALTNALTLNVLVISIAAWFNAYLL